jgi:hypothetical protein
VNGRCITPRRRQARAARREELGDCHGRPPGAGGGPVVRCHATGRYGR